MTVKEIQEDIRLLKVAKEKLRLVIVVRGGAPSTDRSYRRVCEQIKIFEGDLRRKIEELVA